VKRRRRAPAAWQGDSWDHVIEVPEVETAPPRRRAPIVVVWTLLAVFAGLVIYAGSVGWWYLQRINPGISDAGSIPFIIDSDDTYDAVVERLVEQDVIVDAEVFNWYVERNGGLEVIPGFYRLVPGDHLGNIVGRLQIPPERTFNRVTFPEGFTVAQMGERLGKTMELMDAETFMQAASSGTIRPQLQPLGVTSLEGLLFPDTYDVSNSESEAQVIERMVAMMERVARQENLEARAGQLGLTPYEVLIIASMIEREAKLDEDRAKISAVIRNRMFFSMPLQIDATLFYDQDPSLPFVQLRQTDTPYNTYLNAGLPPTPIANPGRASIRAALNPAPNPPPSDPVCRELPDPTRCALLYYVLADERGGHAFAATLEQHEANIERSRQAGVL
jgi:UPF0755 protein